MKFYKLLIAVLLILFIFFPITAFDFGGSINNSSTINQTSDSASALSQSDKATVWFKTPLGKIGSFSLEGNYNFTLKSPLTDFTTAVISNAIDLPLAKFNFDFLPSAKFKIHLDAGRFFFSDASAQIFSQISDGINISLKMPLVVLNFYGSYTGLLSARSFAVHSLPFAYDGTSLYPLAPKYVTGLVRVNLNNILAGQSFGFDASIYYNLNDVEFSDGYNRVYGTIYGNGPILNGLYYNTTISVGLEFGDKPLTYGFMGTANISYYLDLWNSSISLNSTIATDSFVPFTYVSASLDDSFTYTNLIACGVSFTAKPIDTILIGLNGDFYTEFVPTTSEQKKNAFQWKGSLSYQVFSDLNISLSGGQVIPLSDFVSKYWNINLSCTMSL